MITPPGKATLSYSPSDCLTCGESGACALGCGMADWDAPERVKILTSRPSASDHYHMPPHRKWHNPTRYTTSGV